MIQLTEMERELINLCKGRHEFGDEYTSIIDLFSKFYEKHYALDALDFPEWKNVIFNYMFRVYMKIRESKPEDYRDILDLFGISFHKGIVRDQDNPIERCISELYGRIQATLVINDNKEKRFEL